MIFHIAEESEWKACEKLGSYLPSEYANEGFIHCSKFSQVERTANNYYSGREDLVLLAIDPEKLECEIRYENLIGGDESFPHVYGEINMAAVTQVIGLQWGRGNELLGLADIN